MLFKTRLKETTVFVFFLFLSFVFIQGLMRIFEKILPKEVKEWILIIVFLLVCLAILSAIVVHVWRFVKWLFVEPYRAHKAQKL